jgi:predicted nucleic acid-binding protein
MVSQSVMSQCVEKKLKKKGELTFASSSYLMLAERTGLEPATPGVTGRYSNQLNYHS